MNFFHDLSPLSTDKGILLRRLLLDHGPSVNVTPRRQLLRAGFSWLLLAILALSGPGQARANPLDGYAVHLRDPDPETGIRSTPANNTWPARTAAVVRNQE